MLCGDRLLVSLFGDFQSGSPKQAWHAPGHIRMPSAYLDAGGPWPRHIKIAARKPPLRVRNAENMGFFAGAEEIGPQLYFTVKINRKSEFLRVKTRTRNIASPRTLFLGKPMGVNSGIGLRRLSDVPSGPVYSIADIANDEQYKARGIFETVEIEAGDTVKIPAVLPKLTETPGGTDWIGPNLGEHNEEIYRGFLEMSQTEYEDLVGQEII